MKKEIRAFRRESSNNGWFHTHLNRSNPNDADILVCVEYLEEFWDLNDAAHIEIILTDEEVSESYIVEVVKGNDFDEWLGWRCLTINDEHVSSTWTQREIVTAFTKKYGACFIHVNLK